MDGLHTKEYTGSYRAIPAFKNFLQDKYQKVFKKHEIRSSKHETNPKLQFEMTETAWRSAVSVIVSLVIRICFVLRVSNFVLISSKAAAR
jgi:hypothetical protein